MGTINGTNQKERLEKIRTTQQKALFEMGEMFSLGEDTGAILSSDETGVNPLEVDTKEGSSPYGIFNRKE